MLKFNLNLDCTFVKINFVHKTRNKTRPLEKIIPQTFLLKLKRSLVCKKKQKFKKAHNCNNFDEKYKWLKTIRTMSLANNSEVDWCATFTPNLLIWQLWKSVIIAVCYCSFEERKMSIVNDIPIKTQKKAVKRHLKCSYIFFYWND